MLRSIALAAVLMLAAAGAPAYAGDSVPDKGVYRRSLAESIAHHVLRGEHEMVVRDAVELRRNSTREQLRECADIVLSKCGKTLYESVHAARRTCASCGGKREWPCAACEGKGFHQGSKHGRFECWICFASGIVRCQGCRWRYFSNECASLEKELSTFGALEPRKPSAQEELEEALKTASSSSSADAIRGMDRLGTLADSQPRALVALTNFLRSDADPMKRAAAADVMGRSGSKKCLDALGRSLRNDLKAAVRCAAAGAIAGIGDPSSAADLLKAAGSDRSGSVRRAALEGAGFFAATNEDCRKAVASAMDDAKDPTMRIAGTAGAGRSKSAVFCDRLAELLRTDDQLEVRCAAAEALGSIGERYAMVAVEEAFRKDNPEALKLACLRAMARSGDEGMLPLMVAAFASESAAVSSGAVEAVVAFDRDKAVLRLLGSASETEPKVRALIAVCLGRIDDERVVMPLIAMMEDPDTEVKVAAVEAFAAAGDRRGLGKLEALQSCGDQRVASAAARAIACVKDRRPGE